MHPLTAKSQKEKITQTMFETFNTPALYIADPGVLALYSANVLTGLSLDIGSIRISRTITKFEKDME